MPAAKNKHQKFKIDTHLPLGNVLIFTGLVLMLASAIVLAFIFSPIITEEVRYQANPPKKDTAIVARDSTFGIVIPKINANATVIPNVDPYNAHEYQLALTKGVAHAKGTVFPGRVGNSFLFAHSSVNFYEASRYNSIFYLANKLEKGDEIDIYVHKEKFVYIVTEKKFVDPKAVDYLTTKTDKKLLTLMTCWPPGTTFKRLLIIARLD